MRPMLIEEVDGALPSRVSFISRMEKGALGKGIIIFLLVLGSVVFAFPFVGQYPLRLKPAQPLYGRCADARL